MDNTVKKFTILHKGGIIVSWLSAPFFMNAEIYVSHFDNMYHKFGVTCGAALRLTLRAAQEGHSWDQWFGYDLSLSRK